jgi:DNA-binding transcriptional MerR regulator
VTGERCCSARWRCCRPRIGPGAGVYRVEDGRLGLIDDRHVTRRPNGYRDYGDAAVERLRLLLQARRSGMSISEIKALASAFDDGTLTTGLQLQLLRDKLVGLDRQAREVRVARALIATKIVAKIVAKIAALESRQ